MVKALNLRRVHTSQPSTARVEIDWTNPITNGLGFVQCGLLSEGKWRATAPISQASVKACAKGIGYSLASGTAGIRSIGVYPSKPGVWSAFAVACHSGETGVTQTLLDDDVSSTGGNARHFQLKVQNRNLHLIRFNNSGTPFFATSVTIPALELISGIHAGAVTDGNAFSCYINGRKASSTISGTPSTGLGGDWRMGNFKSTGGTPWRGSITMEAIWDRALTDAEMQSLNTNPWQIFRARTVELFSAEALADMKALILAAGQLTQITDLQIGLGYKPVVLDGGLLKERELSEGLPVVLENGQLRTLAAGEILTI